nr:tRNA pseudouridine(55) synthase TruB [Haloglycomyces albus]
MTDQAGFVLIDKPQGTTSHGVVAAMRRIAGTKKVGHGGTLDPMATGLLVIAIGKATKLLTYVSGSSKTYVATVRLGQATTTDDAEGDVVSTAPVSDVTETRLRSALERLVGEVDQVPSAVSAVKVDGKRAYQRVRDGEEVRLKSRRVTIHSLEVHRIRRGEFLEADLTVTCSSGTYVRAIARDVGEELGVGGHLTALRRRSIGPFELGDAHTLEELKEFDSLPVLSMSDSAAELLPTVTVDDAERRKIGYGQAVAPRGVAGPYAVLDSHKALLAVGRDQGNRLKTDFVVPQ